ncbi:hypothetical protein ALT785_370104 [Alteromonas infernus]
MLAFLENQGLTSLVRIGLNWLHFLSKITIDNRYITLSVAVILSTSI